MGEVLLVPEGEPRLFGRGEPRDDDPLPRAALVRQRPARAGADGRTLGVTREARPPLATPFLSRVQLRIEAGTEDVRVENLGRCAMLVGDRKVTTALLSPGDTLELCDQLVLLCVRRPGEMPRLYNVAEELGRFGEADAQGFVGESPAMWALRDRVAFFAARDVHVLLLGESGTGKELVARAIHALSPRGARPLVSRNAATLPAGLVDAELFGNVKNYPQAGMPERPGLIGEANGGVLFLDEIGELPLDLQTHLLRVLDQRGEYQRLGESARRSSDLRLIGATNRAPGEMRSDLVARMSLRLEIPGLNERREDIPLLARHLLRRIAARDPGIRRRFFAETSLPEGGAALEPRIAPSLVRALIAHAYTTHVRELDAILWQSLASSDGDTLELSGSVRQQLEIAAERGPAREPPAREPAPVEITREVLSAAMAKHDGVKERIWRELGLQNRFALNRLLRKHGIHQGPATDADD
ncbi:sigma 54-interacting transcriptional regulator [Sorangium sp. So ce291]|uniref:sigma 54-interacting transcriptional regulator n=1 Tax=Sorangium sp. So ce291 TaxID=3133294 RepID=UPI003F635230